MNDMLEESLDPRPPLELAFAEFVRSHAADAAAFAAQHLQQFWDDRSSAWTNLRNFEHWLTDST
jgi:hypothetical protein